MLTTPHVLTALAILKLVPNPIYAVILAFLSHFILDWFIPHWNPHLYTEHKKTGRVSHSSLAVIFFDGALTLTILGILSFIAWPDIGQIFTYGLVSVAATLPDLIEIPYYFLRSKNGLLKKYVTFEHKNQANGNMFWGIATQVLVIIASFKQIFF
jgi:hypothetical protein